MSEGSSKTPESDKLLFADAASGTVAQATQKWKLLIVDDEIDVHRVTKLVLSGFNFAGRRLELDSAHSAQEAMELLSKNEYAVILLDVVMEEEDSGLKLIKFIREEQGNFLSRIILRTGQAGQAPEQKVILQYDINDYKAKTELSSEKLFTSVIAAIRGYRDILTIEKSKRALEKIIAASATIFELQSLKTFVSGILTQFVSMLNFDNEAFYGQMSGLSAVSDEGKVCVIASTGEFEDDTMNKEVHEVLSPDVVALIEKAMTTKKNIYDNTHFIAYFKTKSGYENIIYLVRNEPLDQWERNMVDILCSNVSIAFENIYLNQKLEQLVEKRTTELTKANYELNIRNQSLRRELEMARKVQESIIPTEFPVIKGVNFGSYYIPMQALGGDYYDVIQFSKRKFGIVVGDVSGHGISASLLTTMAKMSFTNLPLITEKPTDEVVTQLHNSIFRTVGSSGMYMTIFYGLIDLDSMTMQYTNAGHNAIMVLHKDGTMDFLESLDTIVGIFKDGKYTKRTIDIKHGDRIILYTDGFTEAKNEQGFFLGNELFFNFVKSKYALKVEDLCKSIVEHLYAYTGSATVQDDRTLLITEIV